MSPVTQPREFLSGSKCFQVKMVFSRGRPRVNQQQDVNGAPQQRRVRPRQELPIAVEDEIETPPGTWNIIPFAPTQKKPYSRDFVREIE